MHELTARPVGFDYQKQLLERLQGASTALIDISGVSLYGGSEKRKPFECRDGIAIIEISGVLVNSAYWWDETTYSQLRDEIDYAAEDDEVKGILLRINSPGGETDNAFETSDRFRAVGKLKPMWAVADPHAYSAAYLFAATASRIYMPAITGGVGSVGVYCLHIDMSGMLTKLGVKATFVTAGEGKAEGHPYKPLSADAKGRLQAEVDRLYSEFTSRVASGRGMTVDQVVKLGAYRYEGAAAGIKAGLADHAGSAEDALAALSAKAQNKIFPAAAAGQTTNLGVAMNPNEQGQGTQGQGTQGQGQGTQATPPPVAGTAAALPDLAQLRADAEKSKQAETVEIIDMCELAGKGALAAGYIKDGKKPGEVRKALLEARAEDSKKGGEINNQVHAHDAANGTKPAKSLKDRMKATLGIA